MTDLAEVAGQAESRRDGRGAVCALLTPVRVDVGAQKLVGVAGDDDDAVVL